MSHIHETMTGYLVLYANKDVFVYCVIMVALLIYSHTKLKTFLYTTKTMAQMENMHLKDFYSRK